jgi:hypothetical protein
MRRSIWLCFSLLLAARVTSGATAAGGCTAEDFAAAVDRSGAQLRAFNVEALPKLKEKLKELKDKKGWGEVGYEEQALTSVRDKHTAKLDDDAESLILKIDTLSQPPAEGPLDCAKLTQLEAASLELLAVMKAKQAYTFAKLDAAIAGSEAPVPEKPAAEKPVAQKHVTEKQATLPAPAPKPKVPQRWDTETQRSPSPPPPPPPVITMPLPPPGASPQKGYSIDEIQEITRGFFGTISTSLASVLEYAFASAGRPDGYVLGKEGGGAFLAGVRYGNGTLYMRTGDTAQVYWHGPSIGTDFGAAGSRTMFLIYNLRQPDQLMRNFTGVDGSAYFVGGVGVTFLKGGDVIMAPIRSGLGFRLGANLGYIRFTPRPTWNPF